MTNKELFIKCYNAHIVFDDTVNHLQTAKIYTVESKFSDAFYTIFDAVIPTILNEEGQDKLYDVILFEDYTAEEATALLSEYFI